MCQKECVEIRIEDYYSLMKSELSFAICKQCIQMWIGKTFSENVSKYFDVTCTSMSFKSRKEKSKYVLWILRNEKYYKNISLEKISAIYDFKKWQFLENPSTHIWIYHISSYAWYFFFKTIEKRG